MAIYLSMQRVRFSSPDAYEKFKVLFADTRHHLMKLPGFIHLTWWQHPDDPGWFNECSIWASKEALYEWHLVTYHKHAKAWAANGAIMEDIITNFELVGTRLLRVCPVCGELQDKPYDLGSEQAVLREQCPTCDFHFPYLTEQPTSFAVFKDLVPQEQQPASMSRSPDGQVDADADASGEPSVVAAGADGPNVAAVGDAQQTV
jgi:heme-degrading monooxygenase HmoA